VTAAGSHAVARRVTFGTEAVGFLEPAIFGLRAIEHPPRALGGILRGLAPEGSLAGRRLGGARAGEARGSALTTYEGGT
jgi:hypothetical protein